MNINVLLTTWPNHPSRLDYLERTLASLDKHLTATNHCLVRLVSAESSDVPDDLRRRLTAICDRYSSLLVWRPGQPNLGAHLNFAYRQCLHDLRLYIQDDWELHRPLDIGRSAELLSVVYNRIAAVRFYVAHTQWTDRYETYESDVWRLVDKTGPWPIADNPVLSHRHWLELTGGFAEGGDAGCHEVRMISQLRDCLLEVLAPTEVAEQGDYYFLHIGDVSAFKEKR